MTFEAGVDKLQAERAKSRIGGNFLSAEAARINRENDCENFKGDRDRDKGRKAQSLLPKAPTRTAQ